MVLVRKEFNKNTDKDVAIVCLTEKGKWGEGEGDRREKKVLNPLQESIMKKKIF